MKKVLIIFGTRPEAIKMAPVVHQLKIHNSKFKTIICVTAQHREMLDQVLRIFSISPDYDLDIMENDQNLFNITATSLLGLKHILKKEKPGLVMVQGDTTTAFVAGLVSYYLKIPICHIEAGLRTYNKYSPFPEEKNRHLLSVLADYHFSPTEWAKSNLLKEGVSENRIWVTGNTVIDALLTIMNAQESEERKRALVSYFRDRWKIPIVNFNTNNSKLILLTAIDGKTSEKDLEIFALH